MTVISGQEAAERVAEVMAQHPDTRYSRSGLIHGVRSRVVIPSPYWLTQWWPEIELAVLTNHNLYAFRPDSRWLYMVGATTDPIYPKIVLNRREANVITRMRRDLKGGNLDRMGNMGDVDLALLRARYQAHLNAAPDVDAEFKDLVRNLRLLPIISL